jgi:hypothetical protein
VFETCHKPLGEFVTEHYCAEVLEGWPRGAAGGTTGGTGWLSIGLDRLQYLETKPLAVDFPMLAKTGSSALQITTASGKTSQDNQSN